MPNIKPIITPILSKTPLETIRYVERPNFVKISPKDLQNLRWFRDEFVSSTKPLQISLNEVKALFPTGKLEDNYLVKKIKNFLQELKTDREVINLTPELTNKDYKIIQDLMNKDNGIFIPHWKGYSETDTIPNIQKLALFTRTMKLTKQTNDFLEFDPIQWNIVYEGIINKPEEIIMPLLRYKANSDQINFAISDNKITEEVKNFIDNITKYLNMFTVKKDFVAYRGDKTFKILSNIKYAGQELNLAELMEIASTKFRNEYLNNKFKNSEVENFVHKFIINKEIHQSRFMSIGMTENSIKDYVRKIKWYINIPKGTKGASIESFNIERKNEAEFLGQRNGVLKIEKARYCPKKDLWYFYAQLDQEPVDKVIVNC